MMENVSRKQMRLTPMTFSVGGGKGGVGKSMISSNLAIQYAQAGMKVVLIDLDFGAANIHTIFGVKRTLKGLGDYFLSSQQPLSDYCVETSEKNLKIIPGGSFVPEMANIRYSQKLRLMKEISALSADLILLDLGAGTSHHIIDLFSMTNIGIVVTTPEPTAIVNVYEFLKNVIYRMVLRLFQGQKPLLDLVRDFTSHHSSQQKEGFTIAQLIEQISKKDSWAAENVRNACQSFQGYIILNQVKKIEDVSIGCKLHNLAKEFLYLNLGYGGAVCSHEEVMASVLRMVPISFSHKDGVTKRTLHRIATTLLTEAEHYMEEYTPLKTFEEQYQSTLHHAAADCKDIFFLQKRKERKETMNLSEKSFP